MVSIFGFHITPQTANAEEQERLQTIYNKIPRTKNANGEEVAQVSAIESIAEADFSEERLAVRNKRDAMLADPNLSLKEKEQKTKEIAKALKTIDRKEKDFESLLEKLSHGKPTISEKELHARDEKVKAVPTPAPVAAPVTPVSHAVEAVKTTPAATTTTTTITRPSTGQKLENAGLTVTDGIGHGTEFVGKGLALPGKLVTNTLGQIPGLGGFFKGVANVMTAPATLVEAGGQGLERASGKHYDVHPLHTLKTAGNQAIGGAGEPAATAATFKPVPITPLPEASPSQAALEAEIAKLKADNANLRMENASGISFLTSGVTVPTGANIAPATAGAANFIGPIKGK